jgi:hypothetical protein
VKGAGEIADLADNIVIVWKNLTKPDDIIKAEKKAAEADREAALSEARAKPDAFVRVAKQRHHPWEGSFAFWFDKDSQQFLEGERAHPKHVELGEFDYEAQSSNTARSRTRRADTVSSSTTGLAASRAMSIGRTACSLRHVVRAERRRHVVTIGWTISVQRRRAHRRRVLWAHGGPCDDGEGQRANHRAAASPPV